MTRFTLALLFLTLCEYAVSQECVGTFIFHHQSDMDNFILDNPECTVINGDVLIEPQNTGGPDDLLSVDGLQNISHIQGNLSIGFVGNTTDFVFSLASLSNLVSISGILSVGDQAEQPHIMTLQGLDNLTSCEELILQDCYGIETLEPLYQLEQTNDIVCNWGYSIPKSISLINLFPNLTSVSGGIAFDGASYPEFSGFANLISANDISITGLSTLVNEEIGNFNAFQSLQSCFSLLFEHLNINSMEGFGQLQACTYMSISVNSPNPYWEFESLSFANEIYLNNELACDHTPSFPSLTYMDGASGGMSVNGLFQSVHFSSLQSTGYFDVFGDGAGNGPASIQCPNLLAIHGDLYIAHTNVSNLNFLNNISSLGAFVNIIGNHNLNICDQWVICYKIANEAFNVTIYDNAIGCYDNDEVANNCNYASAEGDIFLDLNCDGIFNDSDYSYPQPVILQNQNGQTLQIFNPGYSYSIPLTQGAQTISLVAPEGFTSTNSYSYPANEEVSYADQDFALCPEPDLNNIEVVIIPDQLPRPGFSNGYYARISNLGVNDAVAQVSIDFSAAPGLSILSAGGNSSIIGNIVTWTTPSIPAFGHEFILIQCYVDVSVPLGEIFVVVANADIAVPSVSDSYPDNNQASVSQTVIGSYDPNDISVDQSHINAEALEADGPIELLYTIRFQNTGTASAINVRVQNIFSEHLNPASLSIIACSHDYIVELNSENELIWKFDNINLPDSNANEPLSHGYIVYRISTFEDVVQEDTITNYANIFFDYNLPILTNTATTSFYECLSSPQILGPEIICENEVASFSCSNAFDEYSWSMDNIIIAVNSEITLTGLEAGPHTISLISSTEFCSYESELLLVINDTPVAPIITQENNTLTASGNGEFFWQLNEVDLPGNNASIEMTESGTYSVYLIQNGCASSITTEDFILNTQSEITRRNQLLIYPQPASSQVTIFCAGMEDPNNKLEITDISGRIVLSTKVMSSSFFLDCSELQSGLYFCCVKSKTHELIAEQKLIVE